MITPVCVSLSLSTTHASSLLPSCSFSVCHSLDRSATLTFYLLCFPLQITLLSPWHRYSRPLLESNPVLTVPHLMTCSLTVQPMEYRPEAKCKIYVTGGVGNIRKLLWTIWICKRVEVEDTRTRCFMWQRQICGGNVNNKIKSWFRGSSRGLLYPLFVYCFDPLGRNVEWVW